MATVLGTKERGDDPTLDQLRAKVMSDQSHLLPINATKSHALHRRKP